MVISREQKKVTDFTAACRAVLEELKARWEQRLHESAVFDAAQGTVDSKDAGYEHQCHKSASCERSSSCYPCVFQCHPVRPRGSWTAGTWSAQMCKLVRMYAHRKLAS